MEGDSPARPCSPHELRPRNAAGLARHCLGPLPLHSQPLLPAPEQQLQGRKSRLIPLLPKPNPALWQGYPRAAQGGLASHEGHQHMHTELELAGCEGHAPASARLPASNSQHPQQLKKIITGNRDTSVFQACTMKCHLISYI